MVIDQLRFTGTDAGAATTANTGFDSLVVTSGTFEFDDAQVWNGTAGLRVTGAASSGVAYGLKAVAATDAFAFDIPLVPVELPDGELYFAWFGHGSARNLALSTDATGLIRVRDAANVNAWTSAAGVLVEGEACVVSLFATRDPGSGQFRVVVFEADGRTIRADSGLQTGKNTGTAPFAAFRAGAAKASTSALASTWAYGAPRWETEASGLIPAFVPGLTMPQYTPASAYDGPKNVGNLPDVSRSPYGGTVTGGTTRLTGASYANLDFVDTVLDLRPNGDQTFDNVRVRMETFSGPDDGIDAMVRALAGPSVGTIVFNDSEFHCRLQRIYDVFIGRNVEFNRCVFTGGVDQTRVASTGSSPQGFGIVLRDCWVGLPALWYYPTPGVVASSDTITHNDGVQVTSENGLEASNVFFAGWISPFSGTGTPGSGSESNPNSATYIATQSQMETWRSSFVGESLASQSFGCTPRDVLPGGVGGSLAAVMVNRENVSLDGCWFSGWNVPVNFADPGLPGTPDLSIERGRFWNDMGGGRSLASTAKGTAMQGRSGSSYPNVAVSGSSASEWMDGGLVPIHLV